MKNFLILSTLITVYSFQCFSQPGALDNSYSSNGKTTLLFGKHGSWSFAITRQPAFPTDKILLGGFYINGNHIGPDFLIVRLTSSGTLDNTFSGNGAAGIDFGGDDEVHSVIAQPDGKIAAFGASDLKNIAAVRLKSNGTLDSSFGTNGKVLLTLNMAINAAAIQPDGKFVLAGELNTGGFQGKFAVVRLNTNGTLDNTFGSNGEVITDFSSNYNGATSVAIQPNGKIIVGGSALNSNDLYWFAIARYNTNGTLDVTFGQGGKVTTQFGSSNAGIKGIALQSNGKIIAVGNYNGTKRSPFALARYNSNGTLDNSFAGNGKEFIYFDDVAAASAVSLQPNGKILVTGYNDIIASNTTVVAIACVKTNGDLDNNFGTNGKVTTKFNGDDFGNACFVQPDGKLVIAGGTYDTNNGTTIYKIISARYFTTSSTVAASSEKVYGLKPVLLAQNVPNPFSNTTTISYSIPQQFSSAKIIITDKNGNALKQINLSNNKGLVTVDASTLINGAYQYSLIIDGKIIDSKQMILNK